MLASGLGQDDRPARDGDEALGEGVVEHGMARAVAAPRLDRLVVGTGPLSDPHEQLTKEQRRSGVGAQAP